MNIVYVYGTLRTGSGDLHKVKGKLYNLGRYPGLKLAEEGTESGDTVTIERVEADNLQLANLDAYEGYDKNNEEGGLFRRIPFRDGFIYVYNGDVSNKPVVPEGDWLLFTGDTAGGNSFDVSF